MPMQSFEFIESRSFRAGAMLPGMNPRKLLTLLLAPALALVARASTTPTAKVGVYDSRVVAYAHFFQPAHQEPLQRLIADAKAAKAAGDMARFRELEKQIVADQRAMHLQVFSTAPIAETLAAMPERVAEVEREAGVARLVSKWDEEALRGVAAADRVDVTELLVRDCVLNEKQRQTMQEIAAQPPLPLAKAREMDAAGKL
ncbi:MAG: hypothetical protein KF715_09970 [Candidatus Didemnitutus sp.]|nr:hypothetical protein [Candidatus Didemnitutus sp.]